MLSKSKAGVVNCPSPTNAMSISLNSYFSYPNFTLEWIFSFLTRYSGLSLLPLSSLEDNKEDCHGVIIAKIVHRREWLPIIAHFSYLDQGVLYMAKNQQAISMYFNHPNRKFIFLLCQTSRCELVRCQLSTLSGAFPRRTTGVRWREACFLHIHQVNGRHARIRSAAKTRFLLYSGHISVLYCLCLHVQRKNGTVCLLCVLCTAD